jgi:hypothetical protein
MTATDEAGPAVFSKDRIYRYTLHRTWDASLDRGVVNFIMLNPSTADDKKLDPTLRRCKGFAEDWGYRGFAITNLFAYRSTSPIAMKSYAKPVGPDNDAHILEQAQQANLVIVAWGSHGKHRKRDEAVMSMLKNHGIQTFALVVTKHGLPGHPLFLSSELRPKPFEL